MKSGSLYEAQEKYKDLVNNLSVGVYRNTPGPKGCFLEANTAMLAIFEASSKKEFLKHHVSDLYQDPKERKEFVAEITQKGEVKNREINLITLKGKKIVAAITATMKKDNNGNVYFDGIVEDITERKKIENKLIEYQNTLEINVKEKTRNLEAIEKALLNVMSDLKEVNVRNEAILDSIASGVIVTNKDGIIILMNRFAEKLLGWTKNQSIGKKWFQILISEDENGNIISPDEGALKAALVNNITTPASLSGFHCYVRKDGSKFPVVRTVSPIVLEGKINGAVNVFRDATMDKETDKMKTEFVSLASHQLRTPLTSIKWNLEMILDKSVGDLNKIQEERLKDVFQSNETMITLVNSLLNISRMESGRLTIEPKLTDLGPLFRNILAKMEAQTNKAGLKLIDKIPNGLPKINIDPQLISNVYQNLISNSIRYTPSGGRVEINITKDNNFLVSRIKDTGNGIPENEQRHVFERFFRGSNVSDSSIGSTGLGLYLAKEIIEASGGRIWFESIENKGSTFYFSLPLKGSPVHKGEVTLSP